MSRLQWSYSCAMELMEATDDLNLVGKVILTPVIFVVSLFAAALVFAFGRRGDEAT